MDDKQLVDFLKNGGYITFCTFNEVRDFYYTIRDCCEKNKITIDETIVLDETIKSDFIVFYDIERLKIQFKYEEESPFLKTNIKLKWSELKNISLKYSDEKEVNMLKLLEMYEGRKKKEIEEKYDKQIHEIESNDAVQIFIEQAEQTLKGILNTENLKLNLNSDVLEYTQETIDAKNKIVDMIRKEKHELMAKTDEISALLELAPDFEQKMKILRDYGIIDKKKNVIL